jgi:hypothetical protein
MTIPIEEKQLLTNCPDYDTFWERFTKAGFDKKYHQSKLYMHVRNLWRDRLKHVAFIESVTKMNHTVMVPKEIRTKTPESPRSSPFHDDDMQVKIYNQLVYNGQLLKEQLELFRLLAAKGDKNE